MIVLPVQYQLVCTLNAPHNYIMLYELKYNNVIMILCKIYYKIILLTVKIY